MHYDSQSGKYYELSDKIQTFFNPPPAMESLPIDVSIKDIIGRQAKCCKVIEVSCHDMKPPMLHITKSISTTNEQLLTRCYIKDAFSCSHSKLQTASASLCDLGCDHILLTDTQEKLSQLDTDDITETIETVLYNDIVGIPMSHRVGLVLPGDMRIFVPLLSTSIQLGVKHYDVSWDGKTAPKYTDFLKICGTHGLKYPEDVDAMVYI